MAALKGYNSSSSVNAKVLGTNKRQKVVDSVIKMSKYEFLLELLNYDYCSIEDSEETECKNCF